MKFLLSTLLSLSLFVKSQIVPYEVSSLTLSDIPSSVPVEVSCVFENAWTSDVHPMDYPSENAHWSTMVLVSHSSDYEMWEPNTVASAGVQSVAETGNTTTLMSEFDAAGDNVLNVQEGETIFLTDTSTVTIMEPLQMDETHSLLSTITMIAPSPDWFSGVYNVNLVSAGVWYESFTVSTYPWDAGTDSGDTYDSDDQATDPADPILQLTVDTIPDTNVFLSPAGDSVEPVATWTCSVAATGDIMVPSAAPNVSPIETPVPTAAVPTVAVLGDAPSTSSAPSGAANVDSNIPTTSPEPTSAISTPVPYTITTVPGNTPTATSAKVTCSFENQWTAERHPNDYPEGALWSPMVMASHSSDYQMWGSPVVYASAGVKLIAETGNTSTLIMEMNAAGENVLDQQFGVPLMTNTSQTALVGPLSVNSEHSLISTITMSAPSPDWFSGFYNFDVKNGDTGMYLDSFVIQTFPWDAGTDAGTTYLAANMPIDPALWIYQLTTETVPPSDVFVDPTGETVLPVTKWSCNVVPEESEDDELTSGCVLVSLSFGCTTAVGLSMLFNLLL